MNSAWLAMSARYSKTSSRGFAMVVETVNGLHGRGFYVLARKAPPAAAVIGDPHRVAEFRAVDDAGLDRAARAGVAGTAHTRSHPTRRRRRARRRAACGCSTCIARNPPGAHRGPCAEAPARGRACRAASRSSSLGSVLRPLFLPVQPGHSRRRERRHHTNNSERSKNLLFAHNRRRNQRWTFGPLGLPLLLTAALSSCFKPPGLAGAVLTPDVLLPRFRRRWTP